MDHHHSHSHQDNHENCTDSSHNHAANRLFNANNSSLEHNHSHGVNAGDYTLDDFFNSVRYGSKNNIIHILDTNSNLLHKMDPQGYTCMHWAAKRGEFEILEVLHTMGASLHTASNCESKMYPIHWAASDGKIVSLRFFLDRRVDISAQDANGYTPVVIATQYNQINSVIFLVKCGADLTLKDTNGDSPLHWAAYKGFEEMAGLLLYLLPTELENIDVYGQTPLHLAALRGNYEVVEYLISDYRADASKRDKNGLTPLELCVKKKQIKAEWVIRRLCSNNTVDLIRKLGTQRLKDVRVVINLCLGSNDREVAVWLWRLVFTSNFVASMISVYYVMDSSMNDLYILHMISTSFQFIWWVMFAMCLWKDPSYVIDVTSNTTNSNNKKNSLSQQPSQLHNKYSYDAALEAIGLHDGRNPLTLPNVCHTCRVLRPLRSKHCKIKRRCVHKFDHFCPFVYNTLGRDNYKYFYGLLVTHPICYIIFMVSTGYFIRRVGISWSFTLYLIYSTLWLFLILGLLQYHTFLITANLTTNEQINVSKYQYLKNDYNMFHNPFDKGTRLRNLLDGIFPSQKSYYHRDEVLRDRYSSRDSDHGVTESEGFFEEAKAGLLV
eukprot:gene7129-9728_t